MRPAEHLADVGEAAIDAALVARQQPLLLELPASAVAALAALSPSDADVAPADAADTAALLDALPERATEKRLPTIPGVVPGQFDRPAGCLFSPRCKFANDKCRNQNPPPLGEDLGKARCFYPLNTDERVAS